MLQLCQVEISVHRHAKSRIYGSLRVCAVRADSRGPETNLVGLAATIDLELTSPRVCLERSADPMNLLCLPVEGVRALADQAAAIGEVPIVTAANKLELAQVDRRIRRAAI